MNPEISVIIPAMNEEKYIGFPLKGFKNQSFRNFEIVVVDGGSKDNTVKISKRYGAKVLAYWQSKCITEAVKAKNLNGKTFYFLDGPPQPKLEKQADQEKYK